MLLAIDVGNTHTVVGLYQGSRLAHDFRLSTEHNRTADEYGVLLREMLHDAGITPEQINAAVIASVVPSLDRVLVEMCARRFGVEPLLVGPGVRTGMPVLYENPRDVGADRIVNGIAGYQRFRDTEGGPFGVIVVDFGTATTCDVVSPDGEYLGGAIAPGVTSSTEALFIRAAKLPRVDLSMPRTCLGKNTVHSMQAGIMFGYVGMVDGIVTRLCDELPFAPRVIATGGLAALFADQSTTIEEVDHFLTLDGLRIIHQRNRGDPR